MACLIKDCKRFVKIGHDKCRMHYIGEARFLEAKKRNNLRRIKRSLRRKTYDDVFGFYTCEMVYYDCEARGYCNGDC